MTMVTFSIQERSGAFDDYFLHIESQKILEHVKNEIILTIWKKQR